MLCSCISRNKCLFVLHYKVEHFLWRNCRQWIQRVFLYCWTVCLDCLKRLCLHLLFILHEHFQVKRPLIKYWRYPTIKDKTSNRKSESDDVDTIQISPKLSSYHPGPLEHFPFHQLSAASACFTEQNVLVAKLNVDWKLGNIQSLLASLKKNISTPLTPPPPRAPPAGLFTSPTPPLVIR